jgi:hypothetical protein
VSITIIVGSSLWASAQAQDTLDRYDSVKHHGSVAVMAEPNPKRLCLWKRYYINKGRLVLAALVSMRAR